MAALSMMPAVLQDCMLISPGCYAVLAVTRTGAELAGHNFLVIMSHEVQRMQEGDAGKQAAL